MKFTCAATALILASHVSAYDILRASKLNCREKPTSKSDIVKVYELGDNIDIVCQENGQKQMGSTVWDMTPDGCYVLDYYLYTGYSEIFMPLCSEMSGSAASQKPTKSAGASSQKPSNSADDSDNSSESDEGDSPSEDTELDSVDSESDGESLSGSESEDGSDSETSGASALVMGSSALAFAGLVASLF
ncbi:hypothetical protein IWW50_005968 [Coemansia erecta]|nr:hypothetical protein GGF43_005342 [Coemansia sp. RSA 2618]KAJ2818007.1 hypothetical protein IWW50_005968 [Coemansia erecta]